MSIWYEWLSTCERCVAGRTRAEKAAVCEAEWCHSTLAVQTQCLIASCCRRLFMLLANETEFVTAVDVVPISCIEIQNKIIIERRIVQLPRISINLQVSEYMMTHFSPP